MTNLQTYVYTALNNAIHNCESVGEDVDMIVTELLDYDSDLAGIPSEDIRPHVERWLAIRNENGYT